MNKTGHYRQLNLIFGIFPFLAAVLLTRLREGSSPAELWLFEIVYSEERANYWIDQFNFSEMNQRGEQPSSGPFEKGMSDKNHHLFLGPSNFGPGGSCSNHTSNFLGESNFLKDLFDPVEHSIPLATLLNVHFILHLGLFVMVICLILLMMYFYINLIIIYNKDYFLNKVTNKYLRMYAKYVIFKSRFDIFIISIMVIAVLGFIAYTLHYLIVHPIILQ